MERKSKDIPNQRASHSMSHSSKSQVGECSSFWLLRGPPFDQRDYMISPSESATVLQSEKSTENAKQRQLGPSDIKIDSKYLLDSQRALKKISELIKDGHAEHLVERLEDLIKLFLRGTPVGFIVDDLPLIIEMVEFFSRNRVAVPKYSDFVKTIMQYACEPPKVGKASEMLGCKEVLTDYFTLFAELLATFEEECFQLHILEVLDSLIIRRKLVDLCSVSLLFCHEAMEESQLPCVVATLIETVPRNLYLPYLELALQMVWVSVKTGYLMAQTRIIEFVIWRMDPVSSGSSEDARLAESLEKEFEMNDYYRLLDKSAYLIWSLFAIASKYNVQVPVPRKGALWSLKHVFRREVRKNTQKAMDVRNNLAAILAKLCAVFADQLNISQTGLVGVSEFLQNTKDKFLDIDDPEILARAKFEYQVGVGARSAQGRSSLVEIQFYYVSALAVATEIKSEAVGLADVTLGTNREDYLLKNLLLLCCCLFSRNDELITTLKSHKVIEGILRLINSKTTLPWIPSQFADLLLVGLRTLSELVPKLPDVFVESKGNARLLSTIKWLAEEHFDQNALLEALRTFCIIVTCDKECIIKDVKARGGVKILIDVCFRLLDVNYMKLEHQDKLARIFLTLERLFRDDGRIQTKFKDSCVSIAVKLLRRILADSENDSKWHWNVLVSFGGFLWEAIAWCPSSSRLFVEKSGVFLLLDFIESSSFPVQLLFLGVLVDMTDEGETISHLLTWRGKKGSGILSLIIEIWRKEEFLTKVHRTRNGIIEDVEAPLMTEEQWFLTYQVTGCHIYSPSIAEMACSVRPKVHALYQFLQERYFLLTQIGESTYSLQMKMVEPAYQVYIPLVEHYLALKMGEIWSEVIQDALISGVLPTAFDGHLICTLLEDKRKWACRIKTVQEEISALNQTGDSAAEKELYTFLKTCLLPSALEAFRQLDYIARTSFQKYQEQKKRKQISELKKCLESTPFELADNVFHRTFLTKTNTTFQGPGNVWFQSEKTVEQKGEIVLVSPESCGDARFGCNSDDEIK